MTGRWRSQEGAIPFVVIGVAAVAGILGMAWAGQEWAESLLAEAGGEITVFVLRSAFWAIDLVALQTSTAAVDHDWWTPILTGPALPLYALALLVGVAALIAEVVAGVVTGNTTRIGQAVLRAVAAAALATVGASVLLLLGDALSGVGQAALEASGTTPDAPLLPLQEVLMATAQQEDAGVELFVATLAGVVIVFSAMTIYFILAMRPVLLALLIVLLPMAHSLSVWAPLRKVQVRAWAVAIAVLLADSVVLTAFAVANTTQFQPQGVDRLVFGTFGLVLAAVAPAALARIVGTPELQTPVQSMTRGTRMAAVGGASMALRTGRRATTQGAQAAKGAVHSWRARRASTDMAMGGAGAVGGAALAAGRRGSGPAGSGGRATGGPGGPTTGGSGGPPPASTPGTGRTVAGGQPSDDGQARTSTGAAAARPSGGATSPRGAVSSPSRSAGTSGTAASAANGGTGAPADRSTAGTSPAWQSTLRERP